MRGVQTLVLLLLVAIAVDLAVLTEGAFRFNADESIVGVRTQGRVTAPPSARPEATSSPRPDDTMVVAPRAPHRRPLTAARADGPPARSRLVVSSDERSPEAH